MQKNTLSRKEQAILAVVWCGVQLLLLYFLGINRHEEADKYISLSQEWYNGTGTFDPRQIFYSGYVGLHLLVRLAG